MDNYIVYVQVDAQGRVTAINSSAFVDALTGWIQIDEGTGDRYHHAQGNYLDKPIMDERGVWRYKLVDGAVMERTQAEMDADYTPPVAVPDPIDDLTAVTVDHEYRLILMEMGVLSNDVPTV